MENLIYIKYTVLRLPEHFRHEGCLDVTSTQCRAISRLMKNAESGSIRPTAASYDVRLREGLGGSLKRG